MKTPAAPLLIGDLWGGLAAMLVALPSAIAYGVLAYSGLGPGYAAAGAMAGMLGAAALGVVATLVGRTRGLISAPCAPAAAVIAGMVGSLAAGRLGPPLTAEQILPLLLLTALLAAGLQLVYGAVGGGRLIKFVPFPVVSGYLAAVGLLIAVGQLPRLLGLPAGQTLGAGLLAPDLWRWPAIVIGSTTIVGMVSAPRLTRRVPAAIVGLASGLAAYWLLAVALPELRSLTGNRLVIGPLAASGPLLAGLGERLGGLAHVDLVTVEKALVPAFTLSVLLSIDTLKTGVILDTLTRQRHDSNRALCGQGAGNLAAALIGGMPGSGTLGPSLVNVSSGGRTPLAGVVAGVLVVLSIVALSDLIAWVPLAALAGILLVVSWRMLDVRVLRLLRHPDGRQDFAVIAAVVLVALLVDLIAAAGVGVGLAIWLFLRDQVRGSVIRRRSSLDQVSSTNRRRLTERELLRQHGGEAVVCELQGNLFFGTTDQLLTQLEPDLARCRYLLFDLRRVQSIDYTAAHVFEQIEVRLTERGGQLLFSGLPATLPHHRDMERYLAEMGLVRAGAGVIHPTLDDGLEWLEEQCLAAAGARPEGVDTALGLADMELLQGLTGGLLARLAAVVRTVEVAAGQPVFGHGDDDDELFLVRRGAVRILLPLEPGRRHHLATIGRGDFFGELAFLDRGRRSADAEARTPTELYAVSRERFDQVLADEPELRAEVFVRLARSIADRLRHTDLQLRRLEER